MKKILWLFNALVWTGLLALLYYYPILFYVFSALIFGVRMVKNIKLENARQVLGFSTFFILTAMSIAYILYGTSLTFALFWVAGFLMWWRYSHLTK